mmetsp:Transcript_28602/g.82803  ORF Transcript_28602/g.82803 Transcript_28602/m.82803 type:complete len:186 (+) Transcript_28602:272-829(+)
MSDATSDPTTSSSAHQRTSYLETKLREVTTSANAMTTEFMSLREQLSNENAYLTNRVTELSNVRDDNYTTIAELAEQNLRLTAQNDDIERRLAEVGTLLTVMGGQRGRLMGTVHQWEDGLMVAGREGWRATSTTVETEGMVERSASNDSAVGMGSAGSSDSADEDAVVVSGSDSSDAVFGGTASF